MMALLGNGKHRGKTQVNQTTKMKTSTQPLRTATGYLWSLLVLVTKKKKASSLVILLVLNPKFVIFSYMLKWVKEYVSNKHREQQFVLT